MCFIHLCRTMNTSNFLRLASSPIKDLDLEAAAAEIHIHNEEAMVFNQQDIPEFNTEHTIALEEIVRQQTTYLDADSMLFVQPAVFEEEKLHVKPPPPEPFQCSMCTKSFPYANLLKRHYRIHVGENFFLCEVCLKSFTTGEDFLEHKKQHIVVENPPSMVENPLITNPIQPEKVFQCSSCPKTYSQLSSLKTHERIHNNETSFTCTICQKVFSTANNFKMHERTHTGEKPFTCEVCNKCFAQRNHLQRHNRIHTGEKPYRCDVCDKTFSQQNNLKRHNRLHTGERPYQCAVCEKRFASDTNLRTHERVHSDAEKPFKCDSCEKSFLQMCLLKQHRQQAHLSEF